VPGAAMTAWMGIRIALTEMKVREYQEAYDIWEPRGKKRKKEKRKKEK